MPFTIFPHNKPSQSSRNKDTTELRRLSQDSKVSVTKSLVWVAISWCAIFWLLFASYIVNAADNFRINYAQANNGANLISITSGINHNAHCFILDSYGYIVAEFYLQPYSTSRWYYEPQGYWTWRCQ